MFNYPESSYLKFVYDLFFSNLKLQKQVSLNTITGSLLHQLKKVLTLKRKLHQMCNDVHKYYI